MTEKRSFESKYGILVTAVVKLKCSRDIKKGLSKECPPKARHAPLHDERESGFEGGGGGGGGMSNFSTSVVST